jgi:hypothetical protein
MLESRKSRVLAAALGACGIAGSALVLVHLHRAGTAHASPGPELLAALPSGAPTLVYLDLAAVRASSFYQHRPDRRPIAVPDKDYAKFVQSTGFDFEKDLDRVAIASWPAAAKEPAKTVAVADGRFDRKKIREYAMKEGKIDHQEGREVYVFPAQKQGGWNSLTFLDNHRVALVEGPTVAPLLAAHTNDSTGDPARERAARFDGAAAFAITRVPAIPDNLAAGGMRSTQLASLARSVQWVTLAARPEGDNLRVALEGECDSDTDARQLQSAVELLGMFGRAGLDNPKTRQSMDPATYSVLHAMLESADVTQVGERVRILVELTPDILKLKLSENRKPQ